PSAIEVGGSPHTFIIENTISDSPKGGIILNSPTSVECTNNVLIGCGFFLQGLVPGFPGFSTSGDLVNNKPILYIWNQTNLDVDGTSYSQVILHEAKFCTITNGEFNDASVGVYVSYSTNCTVQDAEVSGNHFAGVFQYISVNCTFDNLVLEDNSRFISPSTYTSALYMFMSQNTTITNCEITDSPFAGLLLGASQRATVSNNVFLRNGIYILGMGIPAAGDYFITEKDNLINGKQFGYFFNKTDLAIDGSLYGQLMIVNSSRLTVTGGDFSEATSGVSLILTENCTLEGATIKKNSLMGLQIVSSTNTSVINCAVDENPYVPVYTAYSESSTYLNNSICRNGHGLPENVASSILLAKSYDELGFNRISHNRFGIQLDGNYVVLHDNNITCNGLFGIFVGNSNFFNISSNIISGNYLEQVGGGTVAGIHVLSGTHGVIHNNSIYSNSGYGISIGSLSAQNIGVYWNEIGWNGVANALDGGTANIWDDDNATGNAWSDYSGSGTYPISMSSSEDRYPSLLTDSTTPTVDSPSNEVFEAGTSGNEIVWHASDDYPGSFVVYQNESVIVNRTWCFDPIEVELDPLDVGTHNLTIVVYDGAGHFVTDMVLVDAVDTISPTIDSPNDIEYVAGSTGNNIEWHGSDLFPASYEVFIDDVSTESGPWTSSTEPITVIVDGLTAGEHNCTIVLTDQGGNSIMDTVIVVVTELPTTPPPTTTTPPPPPDGDGTMIVWLGLAVASVVVVLAFVIIRMRR
ncbi:MAG: right-handed parallel beta-helix repeat-containing protein, partial [Promethearchaeota archaeon]